ncbi:MAG: Crp/Fnr family transcriptional regulator [Aulosira sp. ZfuVER01]|nr:Crp/Fnr family transcriptional regulator [Aulosira sp. ZfuVER01]MDZ8001085.1 Crp/Fnr family transcriptional regulator [Aulosira sp. DedVER01a]MDZ8053211.1 Crp/Fnr family transcriptional regulator [Aulosira sp. ZfuCHP01]
MSVNKQMLIDPRNKLLAALPCAEYERLVPHLHLVPLANRQVIYEVGEAIAYVYFPNRAIISLLTMMNDGSTVEIALVGDEGMAGIPVILGDNISSIQAIVQVPGDGMRINADVLKTEFDRGGYLQSLLLRYVQAVLMELSQGVACNSRHTLEKRFARWLLKVSDRIGSQEFPLTQEFMAQMLGVRRSGVTVAAGIFSQSGIIKYHRGHITILDREALEATSCECYRIVKDEFTRLLGNLSVRKHT